MNGVRGLALAGLLATGAEADTRSYTGEEASALRCANMIAFTAMALGGAELISRAERRVMIGITSSILDRHVSGTWAEKKNALRIMRDRRGPEETIEDFKANAGLCLLRFPIN